MTVDIIDLMLYHYVFPFKFWIPRVNINPEIDPTFAAIANIVLDHDYLLGIHEMLHSKNFVFLDSYHEDGELYSRSAVLMNGLCHITSDDNYGFIVSLGALPFIEENAVHDWSILPDQISMCAESCIDEWEVKMQDEALYFQNYTCFSLDQLVEAANSGKRAEIFPILSVFMEVFGHYSDVIMELSDGFAWSNFEGDELTDETLEAAFCSFVQFIQNSLIPKMKLLDEEIQSQMKS